MNVRKRTIGHAGLDGEYPPNSLAGIRAAARSMDMVEVDVRRCASGEAILFHDAELMPVTGREGRISETGWPTIRTQTIHESDETVIRLADAIGAVSPTVGLNLELKEIGILSAIASLLDGIDHRILISSFLPESLVEVDEHGLGVDTALLFEDDVDTNLERAQELGCTHVHPHYELCLETTVVERAHRADLSVNSWTVRDAATARALAEQGVDGLILDRTGLV